MTNKENKKFIGYFKRTQYGFHAAKAYEWNSDYYGFYKKGKWGYIGGKHNYQQISFIEYLCLKTKYTLWNFFFNEWFRKAERKSWKTI